MQLKGEHKGNMQISPALLRKYFEGHCTEEEIRRVQLWLVSAEEAPAEWSSVESELQVKQEIWRNIQPAKVGKPVVRTIRSFLYYPVAACLLLALFLVYQHPTLLNHTVTINNSTGHLSKTMTIGDLQLSVEPGSECSVEVSVFGRATGNIQFCGAVFVINTSADDAQLQIKSGFYNCAGIPGSDAIHLHKGQTYLAMTDAEYNMISATKEELLDGLPRSFSLRLTERFKL